MKAMRFGVYQYEMKRFRKISQQELDRLFSGKAPTENLDLASIERLVQGTRAAYLTGLDPDLQASHLAGVIKVVDLTDKGDLAVRSASKASGPDLQVSGLPMRRRRFVLSSLFATLTAKIAAGGLAVALATTGGLAATGNLPDEVQKGISNAVENIGIHIPEGTAEEAAEEVEGIVEEGEGLVEDVTETEPGDQAEPNENASFGQRVAADARGDSDNEPGVDGQQISQEARQMAEERQAAGQAHAPEGTPSGGAPDGAGQPQDAGSQGQNGLDKASDTPAGGNVPASVPVGGP